MPTVSIGDRGGRWCRQVDFVGGQGGGAGRIRTSRAFSGRFRERSSLVKERWVLVVRCSAAAGEGLVALALRRCVASEEISSLSLKIFLEAMVATTEVLKDGGMAGWIGCELIGMMPVALGVDEGAKEVS